MKRYRIEFEIFEGQGGQLVKEGDRIIYPDAVRQHVEHLVTLRAAKLVLAKVASGHPAAAHPGFPPSRREA